MNSGTSTEPRSGQAEGGFEVWHFYVLLAMIAATVAVVLADHTHPAALLLLSGAVIAAGLVGLAMHYAMAGFVEDDTARRPISDSDREALEREKALTLRSIKELEFDRAMGKVSDRDYADVESKLRASALAIMEQLEHLAATAVTPEPSVTSADLPAQSSCAACQTPNDPDARFCKQCGARL